MLSVVVLLPVFGCLPFEILEPNDAWTYRGDVGDPITVPITVKVTNHGEDSFNLQVSVCEKCDHWDYGYVIHDEWYPPQLGAYTVVIPRNFTVTDEQQGFWVSAFDGSSHARVQQNLFFIEPHSP
jgi:hypothetical protein